MSHHSPIPVIPPQPLTPAGQPWTPPPAGRNLILSIGYVCNRPGHGAKDGERYFGKVLAVGTKHTRIIRCRDGVEMSLPNNSVEVWQAPVFSEALRHGVWPGLRGTPPIAWLGWSVADHLAHDAHHRGS